jgi:hypothetical protein
MIESRGTEKLILRSLAQYQFIALLYVLSIQIYSSFFPKSIIID